MAFLSGTVTAAAVLGLNVKVRTAYLAEVEQRAARLEFERDQQGQLAVAAERGRIARELHDIVAHNLSVMIALNDGASFTIGTDPERAAAAVAEASSVGRAALRDMRRVLGVLRDDATDAPALAPAPAIADLDQLLGTVRRTGLRVEFTRTGPIAGLSPSLQLSIYRLVQESVTNTVKHAVAADQVTVRIRRAADCVDVLVTDNGRPGPAGGAPTSPLRGHGILGMRERVAANDGQLTVGPTAGGWRVHAQFPDEAAELPA